MGRAHGVWLICRARQEKAFTLRVCVYLLSVYVLCVCVCMLCVCCVQRAVRPKNRNRNANATKNQIEHKVQKFLRTHTLRNMRLAVRLYVCVCVWEVCECVWECAAKDTHTANKQASKRRGKQTNQLQVAASDSTRDVGEPATAAAAAAREALEMAAWARGNNTIVVCITQVQDTE